MNVTSSRSARNVRVHAAPIIDDGPVYRPDGGWAGLLRSDGTLTKRTKLNHIVQRPRGFAWDTEALADARSRGARRMEIAHADGRLYHCPIDVFDRFAVPLERSHGKQKVLPLDYWCIDGEPSAYQVRQEKLYNKDAQLAFGF